MKNLFFILLAFTLCIGCSSGETDKNIQINESEDLVFNKRKKAINDFFNGYEASFNSAIAGDTSLAPKTVVESFADFFVESNPKGVICGQNDAGFQAKITEGFNFYRSIGGNSMHILSRNIDKIDNTHSMVKVKWEYTAIKKDNSEAKIEFTNIYFLNSLNDSPKIFAYIAGDEQRALKEKGFTF